MIISLRSCHTAIAISAVNSAVDSASTAKADSAVDLTSKSVRFGVGCRIHCRIGCQIVIGGGSLNLAVDHMFWRWIRRWMSDLAVDSTVDLPFGGG